MRKAKRDMLHKRICDLLKQIDDNNNIYNACIGNKHLHNKMMEMIRFDSEKVKCEIIDIYCEYFRK